MARYSISTRRFEHTYKTELVPVVNGTMHEDSGSDVGLEGLE